MNSMIQTVDLTKKFNDFVANDHINLDVKEQEIKCIVGENGAGKSTTINILATVLKPDSGNISICGYNLQNEKNKIKNFCSIVAWAVETVIYFYVQI